MCRDVAGTYGKDGGQQLQFLPNPTRNHGLRITHAASHTPLLLFHIYEVEHMKVFIAENCGQWFGKHNLFGVIECLLESLWTHISDWMYGDKGTCIEQFDCSG